jgi:hypothetical protein
MGKINFILILGNNSNHGNFQHHQQQQQQQHYQGGNQVRFSLLLKNSQKVNVPSTCNNSFDNNYLPSENYSFIFKSDYVDIINR